MQNLTIYVDAKRFREEKGWSIRKACEQLGVSKDAVVRWEKQQVNEIAIARLAKFCKVFECGVDDILKLGKEYPQKYEREFGDKILINLKRLREECGLTQFDLVLAIGTLQLSQIQKWEGQRINQLPLDQVEIFCNFFKCLPGDLLLLTNSAGESKI